MTRTNASDTQNGDALPWSPPLISGVASFILIGLLGLQLGASPGPPAGPPPASPRSSGLAAGASEFSVLSEIRIEADGPGGVDTYDLLRERLGSSCIEAPDVFPSNHQEGRHIVENDGSPFGPYFTFIIHRDYDEDKDDDGSKGRQRNEIKGDANSPELIKARNGESVRYHWYFRIDPTYRGEENHTIFFQLHNVDVGPILKIQSYRSDLAIRYDADNKNQNEVVLDATPFKPLLGQWLEVETIVTYANRGYMRMTVKDEAGDVVLHTERATIDMWTSNFTRPKWGIYRALDRSITNSEDRTDFADITIQDLSSPTHVETPPKSGFGMHLEGYPNPFSDRATVAVTLERSAAVRIDLHDALGRRAATLLDSFLPQGRSDVNLDADGLAAGVYVLSMQADDQRASRTMLYQPTR